MIAQLFKANYNNDEMKEGVSMNFLKSRPRLSYWLLFTAKTLFYFGIMLALIYLYHYKNIQGGSFIYNEF